MPYAHRGFNTWCRYLYVLLAVMTLFCVLLAVMTLFDTVHKAHADGPHYYVAAMAVVPEAQGQGLCATYRPSYPEAQGQGLCATYNS